MNIFVAAEGYVPKCLRWDERNPTNYTLKLDPALSVAGTVVDEQDQPVAGVKISVSSPGVQPGQRENVAFNGGNCDVMTDASGRWVCPYVPRDYESVKLILTCSGYAVTDVSVPVGKPESMNAKLVIKRGFTVTGRVLDPEGRPVAEAKVRELHNYGPPQTVHPDRSGRHIHTPRRLGAGPGGAQDEAHCPGKGLRSSDTDGPMQ